MFQMVRPKEAPKVTALQQRLVESMTARPVEGMETLTSHYSNVAASKSLAS